MRYTIYLIGYLVLQALTYLITPLLPAFAGSRGGRLDNANSEGQGTRLPVWLHWFDTPDNSLEGDHNWKVSHPNTTYWDMVAWLYRNSLYGFKWSVLSAPVDPKLMQVTGSTKINYHTKTFGTLKIKMGKYWQYKSIYPLVGNYGYMLNFGWLLDDPSQKNALFMFSPRIVKFDKEG